MGQVHRTLHHLRAGNNVHASGLEHLVRAEARHVQHRLLASRLSGKPTWVLGIYVVAAVIYLVRVHLDLVAPTLGRVRGDDLAIAVLLRVLQRQLLSDTTLGDLTRLVYRMNDSSGRA